MWSMQLWKYALGAKYVEVCREQSMWAAVPVAVRGKVGQLCTTAAAEEEESLDRVGSGWACSDQAGHTSS